jgi:hypothetical protein
MAFHGSRLAERCGREFVRRKCFQFEQWQELCFEKLPSWRWKFPLFISTSRYRTSFTSGEKLTISRQLDGLQTWRAFASAYRFEKAKSLSSHSKASAIPEEQLFPALMHLATPNFDFVTLLSLFDVALERAEWVRLSELRNLGALLITESIGVSTLDDRVLRAWGLVAQEKGTAFSSLKLIMLHQVSQVSWDSLSHLTHLPKLVVYGRTSTLTVVVPYPKDFCGRAWRCEQE